MFAGITMFFWGIIIGPVLMILIVTTIDVLLAVYKGVELERFEAFTVRRRWLPGPATSKTPRLRQPLVGPAIICGREPLRRRRPACRN